MKTPVINRRALRRTAYSESLKGLVRVELKVTSADPSGFNQDWETTLLCKVATLAEAEGFIRKVLLGHFSEKNR